MSGTELTLKFNMQMIARDRFSCGGAVRSTLNSSGFSLYGCKEENPAGCTSLSQGSHTMAAAASAVLMAPSSVLRRGAVPAGPRVASDRLAR